MKTHTLCLILVSILSLVFIFFGMHSPVLARAGGGEAFGGGGSFGGGGFSSGGSGGFFFLPFFFGGSGGSWWWILILLFFVIPFIIRRFGQTPQAQPSTSQQRHTDIGQAEPDISVITRDDPNFSKERFLNKVETAFFAIQKGWMNNDLSEIRGYLSDPLYQRLQMQIDDMKRRNITNMLEQIAIGSVRMVKISQDATYQTITCAILASMIDYKIDNTNKKVVDGDTHNAPEFIEYWTFMRSNNVKTKPTDALMTKTCPNCGAPLSINETGKCSYCQGYVISGDFDWVLNDISQTLE